MFSSTHVASYCPRCDVPARHVHSRYTWTLADLPWRESWVTWRLRVRNFFCGHPRHGRGRSLLEPFKATLLAGWNNGCRKGSRLFRVICRQDFRGQYGMLAFCVRRMRRAQGLVPRQHRSERPLPAVAGAARHRLTPRRATWLVLRPTERSTAQDRYPLAQLTTQAPELAEAVTLALCQRALGRLCCRPSRCDPPLESGPHRRAHQSPEEAEAADVWPRPA
jgi:zinc-finger of transposase IS204/IS1001/IS1096/IS1165